MKRLALDIFDKIVYRFLKNNAGNMPLRLTKIMAFYYPDAIIRKIHLKRLVIILGKNTYTNLSLTLGSNEPPVFIGDNVSIAPRLTLISDSCPINSKLLQDISYVKHKLIKNHPIIIEDDVWIGANVTILPGVIIHADSITGVCTLVPSDVDSYSICAGIPAKKIRDLPLPRNFCMIDRTVPVSREAA
jgi:maltose O-acetyltransferase